MFDAVTSVIPGAKTPAQVRDNVGAAALPPLDDRTMDAVRLVYDELIRPAVHHHW
jgi:aryl-alcohol dehydrogenase-like predicted oxidoreductase